MQGRPRPSTIRAGRCTGVDRRSQQWCWWRCSALLAVPATFAAPEPALDAEQFPIPAVLEPNISFWSDVYSRYTVDQVVLHDDQYLGVVYEVLDMSDLTRSGMSEVQQRRERSERVDQARDRIIAVLRRLSRSDPQSEEEERIWKLWSAIGTQHGRFEEAAAHVRAQTGLRERFAEGLVIAGRYLPGIERVFAAEGVPPILSRLPFVESMFVSRAQSKVGAVGAWQFMPATARLYLQMNPAVDSRIDTILAAEGAARMLRHDYEELRTWPLALTAYNHGRAGVARAVREVGTRDLGEIVQKYNSKRFGFASRNFYSEFVAATTVHSRYAELFPGVSPDPEVQFDQFEMAHFVSLLDLAEATGTDVDVLRGLNPALDGDVFNGTLLLPKAYRLRVPAGEFARFEAAYGALPSDRRRDSQSAGRLSRPVGRHRGRDRAALRHHRGGDPARQRTVAPRSASASASTCGFPATSRSRRGRCWRRRRLRSPPPPRPTRPTTRRRSSVGSPCSIRARCGPRTWRCLPTPRRRARSLTWCGRARRWL